VVRNTFLELFDDTSDAATSSQVRRPRAQTDITDGRAPRKVSWHPVEPSSGGGGATALAPPSGHWAQPSSPYGGGASCYPPGAGACPVPHYLSGIPEMKDGSHHGGGYGGMAGNGMNPAAMMMGGPPGSCGGFPGYEPPWWMYPGPPMPYGGGGAPQSAAGPWGSYGQHMADGSVHSDYAAAAHYAGGTARAPGKAEQRRSTGGGGGQEKNGGGNNNNNSKSKVSSPKSKHQSSSHATPKDQDREGKGDKEANGAHAPPPENATTVMLRNIPNRYTQSMLLALLDDNGYKGSYDFVYLPMDFRNGVNLGYAFVNLMNNEDALRLMESFQGFSRWFFDSAKVCEVSWAHPHQGLAEHIERYRNSPVMHPSMPEDYKPMVFKNGEWGPFPPPTKAIRAPKLRPVHERDKAEGARE